MVWSLCELNLGTDIATDLTLCLGLASEEPVRSLGGTGLTTYSFSVHGTSHSSCLSEGAQSALAKRRSEVQSYGGVPDSPPASTRGDSPFSRSSLSLIMIVKLQIVTNCLKERWKIPLK